MKTISNHPVYKKILIFLIVILGLIYLYNAYRFFYPPKPVFESYYPHTIKSNEANMIEFKGKNLLSYFNVSIGDSLVQTKRSYADKRFSINLAPGFPTGVYDIMIEDINGNIEIFEKGLTVVENPLFADDSLIFEVTLVNENMKGYILSSLDKKLKELDEKGNVIGEIIEISPQPQGIKKYQNYSVEVKLKLLARRQGNFYYYKNKKLIIGIKIDFFTKRFILSGRVADFKKLDVSTAKEK